jgi:hypothetical protein
VLRENRPATLHIFLNACTGPRRSTVLTVLIVHLTALAVLNVYCTDVLQYSFVHGRHRCSSAPSLFVALFHDSGSSLIQLCKVEVVHLQFELFVVVQWFVVLQLCKLLDLLLRFAVFWGLIFSHSLLKGKFPCSCCFSMVGVPASKFCCRPSLSVLLVSVPGNHASSYVDCRVHRFSDNCNAEAFTKRSWELSEEGTIGWGVDAGYAFILWVGKLCLPVLFLLSKVMVLFICVLSSVWFSSQCRSVFFSSAMGTRGN